MLDLNARIDLDEVDLGAIDVVEELDRAGAVVTDALGQANRGGAEVLAGLLTEVRRGRALDHLLVAALHGTVALEQMNHLAALIAENLHFDVPCPAHQFFKEDIVAAEGGLRLAAPGFDLGC